MKLFLSSLIIFFGTLFAAALVALGEPGQADLAMVRAAAPSQSPAHSVQQQATEPLMVARWLGLR